MASRVFFLIFMISLSCGTSAKKKPYPQITRSTDIEKLSKSLDFTKYKPIKVDYQYTLYDNSGIENRSIPGPSDDYLEVLMFFDEVTFTTIQLNISTQSLIQTSPNYSKEEFNFEWLSTNIKKELMQTDSSYHGNEDILFGTNGKIWVLNKKILLFDGAN